MKGTKESIAKLENNKGDIVKYEQRGPVLKTHENQIKTKQAETKIPSGTCEVSQEFYYLRHLSFRGRKRKGRAEKIFGELLGGNVQIWQTTAAYKFWLLPKRTNASRGTEKEISHRVRTVMWSSHHGK